MKYTWRQRNGMKIAHYIMRKGRLYQLFTACDMELSISGTKHVPSYYDNFSYCRRCIKVIGGAKVDAEGNHI